MKYYGKYRGKVIDARGDKEMRGRVLVKVPSIMKSNEVGWAESCLPPGQFFLPRKGDSVWVEFEEGDIWKPIWTGIMPTRNYVKNYIMETSNYGWNKNVIRTGNHSLIMNDEAQRTELKSGENSVILDANGNALSIVGNTINVDGDSLNSSMDWNTDKSM